MRAAISNRPSPALVISILALVVAIGGGTVAAATSDNATDRVIATHAVKHSELWAVVGHNGELFHKRHATKVTVKIPGAYLVYLDRDVAHCSAVASPETVAIVETSTSDDHVVVTTTDTKGLLTPAPFSLRVEC